MLNSTDSIIINCILRVTANIFNIIAVTLCYRTACTKVNGSSGNASAFLKYISGTIGYFTGNINAVMSILNRNITERIGNIAINTNIRCVDIRISSCCYGCILNSYLPIIACAIAGFRCNSNFIMFVNRNIIMQYFAAVTVNNNVINMQEEISIVCNCYTRFTMSNNFTGTITL